MQAVLGRNDFTVVALSIERGGVDAVKTFYASIAVKNLAIQVDPSTETSAALGVVGVPTTLVVDQQGREVGRFVGPANWNAPETVLSSKRSSVRRDTGSASVVHELKSLQASGYAGLEWLINGGEKRRSSIKMTNKVAA